MPKQQPSVRLTSSLRCCAVVLLTLAVLFMPGCSGCRQTSNNQAEKEKEDKEKEKEKPKPDFEFRYKEGDRVVGMTVLPGDLTNGVKPGHWMSLSQPVKANNFDFAGELTSAAVDNTKRPLRLELTPYRMQMSRPVALPKGQLKHLEMNVFLPRRNESGGGQAGKRASLLAELHARGTGRAVMEKFDGTTTMDPHQYYLVALARRPAAYNYLKLMDSVKAPAVGDFVSASLVHYRVSLPVVDQNVPLPSNPLIWTSIAYVIWDDIDPDKLNIDQQDALVDWLHWGGSLIISGPGSLATLKDSFLANYLPALPGDTEKLTQDRFDTLNANFTLSGAKGSRYPLTVVEAKPPEGVQLKLRGDAQYMPDTDELLAERQVGAGRIVVTSFALTNPQIVNWRNFDGFFNACLLKRPARKFYGQENADAVGVRFASDKVANADQSVDLEKDPRLTCGLRYFTRDMGLLQSPLFGDELERPPLFDRGFHKAQESGVGGWNDLSGASRAARDSLKSAAGISVPKRGFVLRVLAVYLLVLVPVNWSIFRVIGRVEWAWAAAPLIAIGGAFWVIHAAQLDIGFARSRTEVAVLELQGEHQRGHLTRYMALYTSLSTGFDLEFEDKNALAQPFATDPEYQMVTGQTTSLVTYHRDSKASLQGFQIASNSTSMLHSEEQRSFGGAVVLEEAGGSMTAINNSSLTLKDVGVIRRLPDREGAAAIEVAWIGELAPKAKATLKFGLITDQRALLSQWEDSPTTMSHPPLGEVSLVRLLDLARDPRRLLPGDVKLIGWTDEDLGGIELNPYPRQNMMKTLVIANLRYQQLAAPTPDVNTHEAVDPTKNFARSEN